MTFNHAQSTPAGAGSGTGNWRTLGIEGAAGGEAGYARGAWALVAALVVARLWLCGRFELAGDEAYFWLWSRQLAWGYFSKGPGIAILIRLGTALCGDTEVGVRLAAILSSAGASLGIYALGREMYSARVGFWAVVVANSTPLFCAGSLLATADMPSICAWTWGAVVFWRLRQGGSALRWAGLGLLLGAGTLIRFVVAVEPLCFGLFLWLGAAGDAGPADAAARRGEAVAAGRGSEGVAVSAVRNGRRQARAAGFRVTLAAMAACLVPWLAWQERHGWVSWQHLLARGALDRPWGLHPRAFGAFLALQAAVVLPYGAGAVAAYCGGAGRRLNGEAWRYLAALSLPLFAFYAVLALNDAGQPNWTGPAYVAAGLLMVATFLDLGGRSAAVRRLNLAAVAAGVSGAVVVHLALAAAWLPVGRDPLVRIRGGADLAEQVTVAARRSGAAFLIGSHYQVASVLAFYQEDGRGREGRPGAASPLRSDDRPGAGAPDRAPRESRQAGGGRRDSGAVEALPVFTPCGTRPESQFDLWDGYGGGWLGRDALYVTPTAGVAAAVGLDFATVETLPAIEARWRGKPQRRYYVYLCRRLLRDCGSAGRLP
jgi:hypothetical protein